MTTLEIWLLAVSLAIDCFTVSVTSGIILRRIHWQTFLKMAFFFGFFQALMPLIGWFGASRFNHLIESYDHWIAFVLLAILGGKMIWESFQKDDDSTKECNPLKLSLVVGMAVATSIDALVVGVSFAFLQMNILWAAFIIGAVTFLVAMLGMLFGKKTSARLGEKMEIIGGLILIALGFKILIEHLTA